MATSWTDTTLGDVVEFTSGGTPSKARTDFWGGSTPWVSAKDMKRFHLEDTSDHLTEAGVANGTKLVPTGTVLLLTRGMTLLKDVPICVTRQPVTFNQDIKAVRPKQGVRVEFLPYLLLGHKERLLSLVDLAGHGTGRLNTPELRALDVSLPPENEQQAIAGVLRALDEKIELNRRISETLERIARAIFKSWFVDFDPVHAKVDGRDPGLSKPFADMFPSRFADSELGPIPAGWSVRTLGEIAEGVSGRSYKSTELQESGTALVTLKSFRRRGGYRPDGLKPYTGPFKPEQVVTPGEVVVACTDVTQAAEVVGRPAIVEHDARFDTLVASLDVLIVRLRDTSFGRAYLYQLLGTETFAAHAYAHTSGTTVLHLDRKSIPEFSFVAPSEDVMEAFSGLAEALFERIAINRAENRMLAGLRDALLPELILGEMRLDDVRA